MKLIYYTVAVAMLCTISLSAPTARAPRETNASTAPNSSYEQLLKTGLRILDLILDLQCPPGSSRRNIPLINTACRTLNPSGTSNEDQIELINNRTCDLINSIADQRVITDCSDYELTLLQCSEVSICNHMPLGPENLNVDGVLDNGSESSDLIEAWFHRFNSQLATNSTQSHDDVEQFVCCKAHDYEYECNNVLGTPKDCRF